MGNIEDDKDEGEKNEEIECEGRNIRWWSG
jgi:hypothetical protein